MPLLTPPPLKVKTLAGGVVEEGMVAKFRLYFGPFGIEWHARHEDVEEDSFVDVQQKGPLAVWRHTHRFEPLGPKRTRVHDTVEYEFHPGEGPLVRLFFCRPALRFLFAFRSYQTRKHCRRISERQPKEAQPEKDFDRRARGAHPSRG
ncbi:MAG: SRPBCC family protein [Polyangiales bacterium]